MDHYEIAHVFKIAGANSVKARKSSVVKILFNSDFINISIDDAPGDRQRVVVRYPSSSASKIVAQFSKS